MQRTFIHISTSSSLLLIIAALRALALTRVNNVPMAFTMYLYQREIKVNKINFFQEVFASLASNIQVKCHNLMAWQGRARHADGRCVRLLSPQFDQAPTQSTTVQEPCRQLQRAVPLRYMA